MKQIMRKTLAVLMALALTVGLLPAMALAASGTAATEVRVGSQTLSSSKPHYVNGVATATPGATLGTDGYTAKFENGTLTLKNFDGGDIVSTEGDLTVEVQGTNRTGRIKSWYGNLTVVGENKDTAVLKVSGSGIETALDVYQGNLDVSNLKELNVSSATDCNPVIDAYFGTQMKFSDIGTMRVSGATTYTMIPVRVPASFTRIGLLEVFNEGTADAVKIMDGPTAFTDCGTILLHSAGGVGMYVYNADVTVKADRLIATGATAGIYTYYNYGDLKVDLTDVGALVLGGSKAVEDGRGPTVELPEGCKGDKSSQSITRAPSGAALTPVTLSIDSASTTKIYDGEPVDVQVSGLSGDNQTFVYTWIDAAGSTLLDAPVNAGTYRVKVYGFSATCYSDFNAPAEAEVTISKADYSSAALDAKISKGNNVISLPDLPEGMQYGNVECTSGNAAKLTRLTRTGETLAVSVDTTAAGGETFSVKVQIPESGNYNAAELHLTLTMRDSAAFDLGTGAAPTEVTESGGTIAAPDVTTAGVWGADSYAEEYGYAFEGWYTAPNGWGDKIADKDGRLVDDSKPFENNHIYYAHWVVTRAVYGYVVGENLNVTPLYVNTSPKTVYTTGLDFGHSEIPAEVNSFEKNGDTLTLKGIHIRATDGCALSLPAGITLNLVDDPTLSIDENTKFYDADGNEVTLTGDETILTAFSGNVILGAAASTDPAFYADGDLTVNSTGAAGISVRQGVLWAAGALTVNNGYVFAPVIQVDGALTLENSATVAADLDSDGAGSLAVQGKAVVEDGCMLSGSNLDAGGLEAAREAMVIFTGNIWLNGDAVLNGAMLDADGYLLADDITISGGASVTLGGMLNAFGQLEISDSTVEISYGGELLGVCADGMTIRSSTVRIDGNADGTALVVAAPTQEGAQQTLALSGAAITTPGVTVQKDASGNLISQNSDGSTAASLTIEPQAVVPTYAVTVAETEHGTVTSSRRYAEAGTRVTLTVTPETGYVLDSLTVTNRNGREVTLTDRGEGKYSFTMPSGRVTVTAAFRAEKQLPAYGDFVDLDPNAWYYDGVAWALKQGLMQGIDAVHFAPDGAVTRSMAAVVLWRMAGEPVVNYAMDFSDVDEGSWYGEAVRWAASEGVIQGLADGTFHPEDAITREQFATMVYRYVKTRGEGFTGSWYFLLDFSDAAEVSAWADEGIHWCVMKEILRGVGDGTLAPGSGLTRAQLTAMLMRLDGALGE